MLKQSQAVSRPTTTSRSSLRVIEPIRTRVSKTPEGRLRQIKAVLGSKGEEDGFVRVTETDLIDAYLLHTGSEDVPPFLGYEEEGSALNLFDMLQELDRITKRNQVAEKKEDVCLYQYHIHPGDPKLPKPPTGWLYAGDVAEMKGVSIRTVIEYCTRGFLTCLQCSSGWYIEPDITLDYWMTRLPAWGALLFRLSLVKEILEDDKPSTLQDLYVGVEALEEIYGIQKRGQYERTTIESFFGVCLGRYSPNSVDMWIEEIDQLIEMAEAKVNS